jgi:putative sigma-54 modulation protein
MIQKLEVQGVHYKIEDKLNDYVNRKIGKLDKYMSKHSRQSAHAQVKLKESKAKDKQQFTCEVILNLPKETLTVKETTVNIYAAVDIVETKLKNLLKKYKETHESGHRLRRKIVGRIRRADRRAPEPEEL